MTEWQTPNAREQIALGEAASRGQRRERRNGNLSTLVSIGFQTLFPAIPALLAFPVFIGSAVCTQSENDSRFPSITSLVLGHHGLSLSSVVGADLAGEFLRYAYFGR